MSGGKGVVVELTGELDLEQRAPGWGRRGPWGRARFLTEASVTTGTGRDWGNFCSPLAWLSDKHKAGGVEGVFGAAGLGAETASPGPPRTQKTREEKGLGKVVTGGHSTGNPDLGSCFPCLVRSWSSRRVVGISAGSKGQA